jgi:hypothetical protein
MECYCYLNVDLLSVQHLLAILFWQLFGVQIGTDMSDVAPICDERAFYFFDCKARFGVNWPCRLKLLVASKQFGGKPSPV